MAVGWGPLGYGCGAGGHGDGVGAVGIRLWGDGDTWDVAMGWDPHEQGHITTAYGDMEM